MKIAIFEKKERMEAIKAIVEQYSETTADVFDTYLFESAKELLESGIYFDILFLSAENGGTKTGAEVKAKYPYTVLIYIADSTAHLDGAFSTSAFRYLITPIEEQRILDVLFDAVDQIKKNTVTFFIKDNNAIITLHKKEIIYIEIVHRKTKIVTHNATYFSHHTLTYWRDKLSDVNFVTPHNSYVVNLHYVTYYRRNKYVVLYGVYRVNISRTYGSPFNSAIMKYVQSRKQPTAVRKIDENKTKNITVF